MSEITDAVNALTNSTTALLSAVNVKKVTLDQTVMDGAAQVALAATQAGLATTNGAAQVSLAAAQVALATIQAGLATSNGAAQVTLAAAQAAAAKTQADIVAASASLVLPARVNSIGAPGAAGFGIGICPTVPAGFVALPGATDPASANYGNYMFQDGSVMCWIPKFWYRIANALNPTYAAYLLNSVDVRGLETYTSTALANAAGYALHRMFMDGGVEKAGCFVDKYKCSQNPWGTGHIASSIANGNPISTAYDHNTISNLTAVRTAFPSTKAITAATKAANCQLTINGHGYVVGQRFGLSSVVGMVELNTLVAQVVSVVDANNVTVNINSTAFTTYISAGTATAGTNAYYAAITAAQARDGVNGAVNALSNFFCSTRFIQAGLALLSLAHGQASSTATYCAWYSSGSTNFPKGCNNNALKDCNDTAVTYQSDGYSNCGKTGSAGYGGGVGNIFAKTTHNGQSCGVADLNGLVYEINPALTCITTTLTTGNAIIGISLANPCVVSMTNDPVAAVVGQQACFSSIVGTTQLNGIHTVAAVDHVAKTITLECDSTAYTPWISGGTITIGNHYVWKTSAAAKSMTPGNTLATDIWGATGVAAHSSLIAVPFNNGSQTQCFGNAANQVLSAATSGDAWQLAGLAFPKDANGVSLSGSSLFGNDYFYQQFTNELVPVSSGNWSNTTSAGVWSVSLSTSRTASGSISGFRCACYPA